jgi:hypothetical protein
VNGLLAVLGAKLTDRWLSLLALPGMVFVTTAVWGVVAGHHHAFEVDDPWRELVRFSRRAGVLPVMTAAGLVIAAIVAGYVARGAGGVVRTVWFGQWRGPAAPLGAWLTTRRRARAERVADAHGIDLIVAYLPARSTWMAERLRLSQARVAAQYGGLDLPSIWPRLWLLVPEETRTQVAVARGALESASVLAGWGLVYLALGAAWYPATLVGLVLLLVAWRLGRARSDVLAELIESTVDVYLPLLLSAFGVVGPHTHVTREVAAVVNDRIRKGS